MFFLTLLFAVGVARSGSIASSTQINAIHAELAEAGVNCSRAELQECTKMLAPELTGYRHRLPASEGELNALCRGYEVGIACTNKWIEVCLSTHQRQVAAEKTAGMRTMMKFLCHDKTFRRAYLNETQCWLATSDDWETCFRRLHEYTNRPTLHPTDMYSNICCGREHFQKCFVDVGRSKCSQAGAILQRRMADTIGQDQWANAMPCPKHACNKAAAALDLRITHILALVMCCLTLFQQSDSTSL